MSDLDLNSVLVAVLFIGPLVLLGTAYLMRKEILNFFKSVNGKKLILTLIASGSLFFALSDGLPYGYFTLMRFVICAVTAYLAFLAYEKNSKSLWVWTFGFIAVLFNPFFPVHLERDTWVGIDLIVGIFLLSTIFIFKPEKQVPSS